MRKESRLRTLGYKVGLLLPDSLYVRLKYWKSFGRWPNLGDPQLFSEKLNWLKLHDHNPLYTVMVDKYEVKEYISSIIGEEYVIPTYGIWEKAEDINFESLPDKFVLKATHDSGRVIICHNKAELDKNMAVREMRNSLRRNFYASTREWPYKNVKPRIIAEKLLEIDDEKCASGDIFDYKFFCFNGTVKFMKIDFDRDKCHGANYYNRNFELLELEEIVDCPRNPNKKLERPINFDKMIELAEMISQNIRFLRVDFYEVNGKIYFGEATFFPASGVGHLGPDNADLELGKLLKL